MGDKALVRLEPRTVKVRWRRALEHSRAEMGRCRYELGAIRSQSGYSTSALGAAGWSAAAVAGGNLVVVAGRRYGADQWITLFGVAGLGVSGWWWLAKHGVTRAAVGVRLPRAGHACVLWTLVVQAA